ncbi:MAG: hypothetical protein GF400_04530 [Candidatus Eisenbacteria bacterium]|nr:hypothetical protein [Candidatus Eisenbacteria bacterium]
MLANLVFTGNTAGNHGAGLHCERGDVVVRDCVFTGNTAGSGAGAWVQGRCRPRFVRCLFDGNTATGSGGALGTDLETDLSLAECEFTSNSGASGGAVCIGVGTATVRDCAMSGNAAEFGAGLCLISATDISITGTAILEGEASLQGGGIYASDSTFDLADSVVSGNGATLQGGAVFMLNSEADVSRCGLRENRTGGSGDGFYVDGSTLVVGSSEFALNGVAIHVQGREPADARWNWWGCSSGPYHPVANPSGEGDEVTGGVVFEPWNATAGCEEVPAAVPDTWTGIKAAHRSGP